MKQQNDEEKKTTTPMKQSFLLLVVDRNRLSQTCSYPILCISMEPSICCHERARHYLDGKLPSPPRHLGDGWMVAVPD